jgi:hypothetical protein
MKRKPPPASPLPGLLLTVLAFGYLATVYLNVRTFNALNARLTNIEMSRQ